MFKEAGVCCDVSVMILAHVTRNSDSGHTYTKKKKNKGTWAGYEPFNVEVMIQTEIPQKELCYH